jgi:hypothetical protein
LTAVEPKRPLELYGHRTDEPPPSADTDLCPFRDGVCVKQRKSDPTRTIGTCIVGFEGQPQLICPVRMRATHQVFEDAAPLLSPAAVEVMVIPEVSLPRFGNVDFVLAGLDRDGRVVDFLGLEIQTNDTTASGPLYEARNDYFAGRLGQKYSYGLNWKMTAKLVLKQTLDKSAVFAAWGKKYVWAMQDTLLARMRGYADMTDFGPVDPGAHEVFFHAYRVVADRPRYRLELTECVGSDLEGVAKANAAPTDIKDELLEGLNRVLEAQAAVQTRGFRLASRRA